MRPTRLQRVQKFVGGVLSMLGFERLGWDVASYSHSARFACICGRRSHTEREHLVHDCDEYTLVPERRARP